MPDIGKILRQSRNVLKSNQQTTTDRQPNLFSVKGAGTLKKSTGMHCTIHPTFR